MRKLYNQFVFVITTFLLFGCGNYVNTPIKTINDQKEALHKTIEKSAKDEHILDNYQSLSFGQMKVFKPDAFIRLDSLYAVKAEYLKNSDYRGLKRSGIEDLIPGYRAEALEEIDEVQYEIEHIYQTSTADSIKIHSAYYLFDYKDSLILINPFYNFQIQKKHKDLYYAYQFDFHFLTTRNLNISQSEWQFLQFFKSRQFELIGSDRLAPFMNHTMKVMEAAKKATTTDFINLSKILAMDYFKTFGKKITIDNFGELMALEKNGNVIGYEFIVDWTDDTEAGIKQTTSFGFTPYLEIVSVETGNP